MGFPRAFVLERRLRAGRGRRARKIGWQLGAGELVRAVERAHLDRLADVAFLDARVARDLPGNPPIQADQDTPIKNVTFVMDVCRKTGLNKFSLQSRGQ